jgi:hypothetical protein
LSTMSLSIAGDFFTLVNTIKITQFTSFSFLETIRIYSS